VSPGGLELLGVRLVDGRAFHETDDLSAAPVVIVDERLARRTWPGQPAVGRRLGVDPFVTGTPSTWATVIGVVSHVRHRSPSEEVRDQVYFTARQATRNPSVYLVKARGEASALMPAIRDAIRALDPALPIYDVQPLAAYVERARALRTFTAALAAIFAAAALLLAAVGIHGVVAYAVTERRREFGVRRALGAGSPQLARLVVGECAAMTTAGLALGLAGAAAGASWLRTQLVGIPPWDPPSIAATIAVLLAAALLACAAPVRRALRADPAHVLREA
jgi:putative ABC transport system permease protein